MPDAGPPQCFETGEYFNTDFGGWTDTPKPWCWCSGIAHVNCELDPGCGQQSWCNYESKYKPVWTGAEPEGVATDDVFEVNGAALAACCEGWTAGPPR